MSADHDAEGVAETDRRWFRDETLAELARAAGADPASVDLGALDRGLRCAQRAFMLRKPRNRAAETKHLHLVETLARRLAAALSHPLADCMPWLPKTQQFAAYLPTIAGHARLMADMNDEAAALARPDAVSRLHEDLLHIYSEAFGHPNAGGADPKTSPGCGRFIAAALDLLREPVPTAAAIKKNLERASKRHRGKADTSPPPRPRQRR